MGWAAGSAGMPSEGDEPVDDEPVGDEPGACCAQAWNGEVTSKTKTASRRRSRLNLPNSIKASIKDGRRIAEKFSTGPSLPIRVFLWTFLTVFQATFSTDFSHKGIETLASGLLDSQQPLNADVCRRNLLTHYQPARCCCNTLAFA